MMKMQHFIPLYAKALELKGETVTAVRSLTDSKEKDEHYLISAAKKDERQTIKTLVSLYNEQKAIADKLNNLEVELDEAELIIDRFKQPNA